MATEIELKPDHPAISRRILSYPDASDVGTASFTIRFLVGKLPVAEDIASRVIQNQAPTFEILVNIYSSGVVAVTFSNSGKSDSAAFRLPSAIDQSAWYELRVGFEGWRISSASLGNQLGSKRLAPA